MPVDDKIHLRGARSFHDLLVVSVVQKDPAPIHHDSQKVSIESDAEFLGVSLERDGSVTVASHDVGVQSFETVDHRHIFDIASMQKDRCSKSLQLSHCPAGARGLAVAIRDDSDFDGH